MKTKIVKWSANKRRHYMLAAAHAIAAESGHGTLPANVPVHVAEARAVLIEGAPELLESLKSCANVFKGWIYDANPHKDLEHGESADYDAACNMLEMVNKTISNATGSRTITLPATPYLEIVKGVK